MLIEMPYRGSLQLYIYLLLRKEGDMVWVIQLSNKQGSENNLITKETLLIRQRSTSQDSRERDAIKDTLTEP